MIPFRVIRSGMLLAGLLIALSGSLGAAEGGFTARLSAEEQAGAGLDGLSVTELAMLDLLVADDFVRIRREKMELATKANAKQAEERKKIQAFIDRFKAKASKAAQAQSRVKMLERMGPPVAVVDDRAVSFDLPSPDELAPPSMASFALT